jgi:hypothetical protein
MQHPNLTLNWLAIITAVVAAFIFAFLWYGPLFGKPWAKAMGMSMEQKPDPKQMMIALGLQLVGTFLTAFVLAHEVQIWRPSVWGVGQDASNCLYGLYAGFFTWIGFYVPMQFGKISWGGRPWRLFFINAGQDFFTLQIIAQILANWR